MSAVTHSLFGHKLNRFKWDMSNLTKEFAGLGSHAISMTCGLKLESQEPSNSLDQNHDCSVLHLIAS